VIASVGDRPISFEVFADDFPCMEAQAREIASWGPNVCVKIPVTNTLGEPALDLMNRLAHSGVQVNATALMTLEQVRDVASALSGGAPSCVSVFAGRIADTGRDPVPIISAALEITKSMGGMALIWASPREVLNIIQADDIGCDIITVTPDLLKKLGTIGKDLDEFSLETVRMFYNDAQQSGFRL
jgi:transaldolase